MFTIVSMKVTVKLFASLRKYRPESQVLGGQVAGGQVPGGQVPGNQDGSGFELEVGEDATVRQILTTLRIPQKTPAFMLVNGHHARSADKLKQDDVVSLTPPMAGG